jgi:uncharacterized protein
MMTYATVPAPIQPNERIDQIDILRGVALFGVLAINLLFEFRVSIFQQFVSAPPAAHALDRWIEIFFSIFLEMKAFALFSLLFGIGLAIQFDRIRARGGPVVKLLLRRLLALLLLGVIDLTLIWNGEILTEYAVAGLIALPFLFLPRRWLTLATVLFAARYIYPYPAFPIAFKDDAWFRADLLQTNVIYKHGSFAQILFQQWHELPAFLPFHIYIMARTVALFLLGVLCWRSGLLRNLGLHTRLLAIAGAVGLTLGIGLTVLTSALVRTQIFGVIQNEVSAIGELALALGYAATILYLATDRIGNRLLAWAAPLGRMAFTNYIAQSLIFSFVFYGWGLGLYGMRSSAALLLGIEWLWRTMMYGNVQPMMRGGNARAQI